jgi:high-affinity Fe2+/Pb2+ permease
MKSAVLSFLAGLLFLVAGSGDDTVSQYGLGIMFLALGLAAMVNAHLNKRRENADAGKDKSKSDQALAADSNRPS